MPFTRQIFQKGKLLLVDSTEKKGVFLILSSVFFVSDKYTKIHERRKTRKTHEIRTVNTKPPGKIDLFQTKKISKSEPTQKISRYDLPIIGLIKRFIRPKLDQIRIRFDSLPRAHEVAHQNSSCSCSAAQSRPFHCFVSTYQLLDRSPLSTAGHTLIRYWNHGVS